MRKAPQRERGRKKVGPQMTFVGHTEVGVSSSVRPTPWLLWPFVLVWRFVTWILGLTGRLLAILLGVVLMILGVVISLTIIGAILGVPLAILGFLLVLRGLF
jgi:hypothetical protein